MLHLHHMEGMAEMEKIHVYLGAFTSLDNARQLHDCTVGCLRAEL